MSAHDHGRTGSEPEGQGRRDAAGRQERADGWKITHMEEISADEEPGATGFPARAPIPAAEGSSLSDPRMASGPNPGARALDVERLEGRLAERFQSLAGGAATLAVPCATVSSLGDYPEGAFLPDPDMMASVVLPATAGISGTAVVSFAPEAALALIRAWSNEDGASPRGDDAIARYREGALVLAAAALSELALEPGNAELATLAEDALIVTLLATHAPPDTSVLSVELAIRTADGDAFSGVFVLLADAKALGDAVTR